MLLAHLLLAMLTSGAQPPTAIDPQQAAKDARVVQALLRLRGVDVNEKPRLKSAVLRHLATQQGTEKYVELVERLNVRGTEDELVRLAVAQASQTTGVKAAALLIKWRQLARFKPLLGGKDEQIAARVAEVLGHAGDPAGLKLLQPLVVSSASRVVKVAAARALGRNRSGQQFLLQLVRQGELPTELHFAVANALHGSPDPQVRAEVQKYLQLPEAAGSIRVPPLTELVGMPGDANRGQRLFQTTATCAKCHQVHGKGKEVGPDLSEIGSKLTKEALFVSILDPSAGISHNYETYLVLLDNGNLLNGLIVSRADESITLRTAEAIDIKISVSKIDELSKQSISLMPADIQKSIGVQDLVDVVAYLSTLKKR